jgi:hypothetical protein
MVMANGLAQGLFRRKRKREADDRLRVFGRTNFIDG